MTVPYSLIEHVAVNSTDPAAPPTVRGSQAGDDIFEVTGMARAGARPGDLFGSHPLAAGTVEAADLALEQKPAGTEVEVAPAAD